MICWHAYCIMACPMFHMKPIQRQDEEKASGTRLLSSKFIPSVTVNSQDINLIYVTALALQTICYT